MNIAITFRQMEASEAVKFHANEKVAKLQKFLKQPMIAHVTCSCEKERIHCVEIDVRSGAEHFIAHERSEDMHSSIDLVVSKLEHQIREAKAAATSSRKGADRASQHLLTDESGEE